VAPGGAPLAEFWERLLAYLIDYAILAAAMLIPVAVAMAVLIPRYLDSIRTIRAGGTADFGPLIIMYVIVLVILLPLQFIMQYLYRVSYLVRTGQTVGKRVMKIKIVRATDGGPIDRPLARRRWVVEFLGGVFGPYFAYADGLWQLWDQPFRQCLHDKCAQTLVVKVTG
jgi:uncharacterized RDD family membrane protein YckC